MKVDLYSLNLNEYFSLNLLYVVKKYFIANLVCQKVRKNYQDNVKNEKLFFIAKKNLFPTYFSKKYDKLKKYS